MSPSSRRPTALTRIRQALTAFPRLPYLIGAGALLIGGWGALATGARAHVSLPLLVAAAALGIGFLMTDRTVRVGGRSGHTAALAVLWAATLILGWPEEGASLVLVFAGLVTVAEYPRARAAALSQRLLELVPRHATVWRGPRLERLPREAVQAGDLFIVHVLGTVAVDGVIRSGDTTVRMLPAFGPEVTVARGPGDDVIAGTTNLGRLIEVQARCTFAETTLSRLVASLEAERNRRLTAPWGAPGPRMWLALAAALGAFVAAIPLDGAAGEWGLRSGSILAGGTAALWELNRRRLGGRRATPT